MPSVVAVSLNFSCIFAFADLCRCFAGFYRYAKHCASIWGMYFKIYSNAGEYAGNKMSGWSFYLNMVTFLPR
ncbi:hypothetical protein TMES_15325 [Thalassospira mesophila]|uniref:Secreted protein n=1 Tax=Thalassospira mesophila TaxID=1293891 RepID=A0A1Y2KXV2_9PROT|nr:hypothetical protein TMES_15325 [Thalassospira mesophila]